MGDGVDTSARTQYLGNITAGGSGNIGFALTPSQEGEMDLVLKISYENADQQLVTREFPVTLKAEEPPMDDLGEDIPMEEKAAPSLAGGGPGDRRRRSRRWGSDAGAQAEKGCSGRDQDWDNWEVTGTDAGQKEE